MADKIFADDPGDSATEGAVRFVPDAAESETGETRLPGMDASDAGATPEADLGSGAHFVRGIRGWLRGKGRVALCIAVGVSGVSAVVGVAHLTWVLLLLASCAITAIATLAALAVEGPEKDRVHNLWAALAVACLIPVTAFLYHEWWDPSRTAPTSFQAVVDGSGSAEIFYPYNEPGGAPGYAYKAIPVGTTISLSCSVSLPRGGLWFRIAGNGGWVPHGEVQAIPGISFLTPPPCT
jgi:hypothetical protein